jgi:hypothetical protein
MREIDSKALNKVIHRLPKVKLHLLILAEKIILSLATW